MRVIVRGDLLQLAGPYAGMLVDFYDISKIVTPLLESKLDHHYLNETTELANPTSEELAQWIYSRLKPLFGVYMIAIEVDETCTSSCRYEP